MAISRPTSRSRSRRRSQTAHGDRIVDRPEHLIPLIAKAKAAAPGFINIWLSDAVLQNEMKRIVDRRHALRRTQKKNQRVLVEHTQINPNKEPHIGHLRNACIGDR